MKKEKDGSALVSAAKVVGGAVGKVAALVGGAEDKPAPVAKPKVKVGKLQKKNKQRLPRKEKKAMKKAAAINKA